MPYLRNAFSRPLSQIFTVAASPGLGLKTLSSPGSTFFSGAVSSARTAMQFIRRPRPWDTRSLSRECAAGSPPSVATRTIPSSRRGLLRTQATLLPHDMLKVHRWRETEGETAKTREGWPGRISSSVSGRLFRRSALTFTWLIQRIMNVMRCLMQIRRSSLFFFASKTHASSPAIIVRRSFSV